jgi:pyruvate/2-oxoglutarate dehydrogenase complex dihydrolipoamide acyltransferase (E2) component
VSSSSTEPGTLVDVTMPQMGVSVSEGTVVEWRKQVGDWVAYEETICEISTDKIDTEVPSPAAGRLAEIVVDVGTTVEVGVVLARIATDAKAGEAHPSEESGPAAAAAAEPAAEPRAEPEPATRKVARSNGGRRYSPVVQRIAAQHGVDLEQVEGTGRGGRVRKQDVLAFIENGGAAQVEPEAPMHIESPYRPDPTVPTAKKAAMPDDLGGVAEPLPRIRTSIGQAMRHALDTAAHCTTIVECDMSAVEGRRRELGLTALPLVARHVIDTLREFPILNATLEETTLTRYERVHLGIAVSLGEDGLIVPVIHDAQDLSAEGLGKRIKDLAARARSKELTPDEVRGGTFTITNPGAFGAIAATPVINVPQVAILDLEAIVKRPVVVTDEQGTDAITIRPMANLCLSWDHRALDGAYAAQFLTALRRRIETPI